MPSKLRRIRRMEKGLLHASGATPGAQAGSLLRWGRREQATLHWPLICHVPQSGVARYLRVVYLDRRCTQLELLQLERLASDGPHRYKHGNPLVAEGYHKSVDCATVWPSPQPRLLPSNYSLCQ